MAAQETLAPFPLIFGPLSFSSLSRGRAAVPATGTREAAEIFLSICRVLRGTTESAGDMVSLQERCQNSTTRSKNEANH